MCIRDRGGAPEAPLGLGEREPKRSRSAGAAPSSRTTPATPSTTSTPVSYTHLTLPTICSV
eukprot:15381951-Alexandrium_andersonii.AAC.1